MIQQLPKQCFWAKKEKLLCKPSRLAVLNQQYMKVPLEILVFSQILQTAPLSSLWDNWPSTYICMAQTLPPAVKESVSFIAWVII